MIEIKRDKVLSPISLIPVGLFLLVYLAQGGDISRALMHYFGVLAVAIVIVVGNVIYLAFKTDEWHFDWFDFVFGFSTFLVITSLIAFFV